MSGLLTLLATPLNFMILRALADKPMRLAELRQATGLPAQTTLRGHLASLGEVGVVRRRPATALAHSVENELTEMGRDLLGVADLLERWLDRAPNGSISLETSSAKGVVKAFVDGWGSTMMARSRRSADVADRTRSPIPGLSYPALERRLSSMRMAGSDRAPRRAGDGHALCGLRVGPLRCRAADRRNPLRAGLHVASGRRRSRQGDIEATFMLALPLVGLPEGLAGSCQLEVEPDAVVREQAAVRVEVESGRVVACDPGVATCPPDSLAGSAATWFVAVKEGTASLLGSGGELAEGLIKGLHSVLAAR